MANKNREITIKVTLDGNNAVKGSAKVKQSVRGIKDATGKASKGMKGFGLQTVATGAIAAVALNKIAEYGKRVVTESYRLATAAQETASKYKTVLGPSIEEANTFLDANASKMGLNQTAAKDLLATNAAIAQGFGFTGQSAADMAIKVVKLAGDLTSFNNVPIERTQNAVTSALSGETEALKSLGIVLRQADVQQRALENTGKSSADALTQQERATASLQLITEKAGVAIGDLNRTQNSTANQARKAEAEFENLKINLAKKLLPTFNAVVNSGGNIISVLNNLVGPEKALSDAFTKQRAKVEDLKNNIVPLLDKYDKLTSTGELSEAEQVKLNTIIKTLGENVPFTAKKFDEYGNIIGINTGKTREFIKQQQEIAKLRTADEFDRQKAKLASLLPAYQRLKKQFDSLKPGQATLEVSPGVKTQAQDIVKYYRDYQGKIKVILDTIQNNLSRDVLKNKDILTSKDYVGGGSVSESLNKLAKSVGFVTDKQDENTKSSKDQKNALDAAAGKGDKGGVKGLTEQIKAQKQALSELQNKQGQLTDSQVREEVQRQRKITQLEQIVAARKKELTLRVQQAQADTTAITGADYKSPDATGVSDTAADPRLMAEHALQSAISKTAQMNRNADAQARQANQNQVESHQQLGRAILQNALYQAQYAHSVQGAIKGVIKGLINAIIAYEIRNALQSASATGPAAFFSSAGFITAAVAAGKAVTSGLLNFETGGVLNGPSHARGGIPVMRRGLQIAEAQGNEAFINTKSTKMFYDELSAINAAGGGSRFPGAKPVVSGPASFAGGGVLKADLGKDYAARAMSSAGLVDSLRKALESANLVAPVELRRFSDEQNNEKSIQRAIGNKA